MHEVASTSVRGRGLGRQHLTINNADLLAVELGQGEAGEILVVGLAVVPEDTDGLCLAHRKARAVRAVMDTAATASDTDVAGQLVDLIAKQQILTGPRFEAETIGRAV